MRTLEKTVRERDTGKRMVLAVLISGDSMGYRCILEDENCVFEQGTVGPKLKEEICRTAWKVQKNGCVDVDGETIFCEVLQGNPGLVICGGGHVSAALVKMSKILGLPVTVLEDRPMFADKVRAAGADRVICDSFAGGLNQVEGNESTYFVIVTRGHRYDKECLEAILKKKYAYVGMMGSRSRVRLLKETLLEEGYQREILEGLHAPIGISIGSETPEEIAVSIMGEIIQVKNSGAGGEGFSGEILKGLKAPARKVLATIVSRKGSAPRKVGTKMLVMEDGTTVGTIGGGCAEAEMMQKAFAMLRDGGRGCVKIRINMTNREAGDEGMVCGGIQDILLEVVE